MIKSRFAIILSPVTLIEGIHEHNGIDIECETPSFEVET